VESLGLWTAIAIAVIIGGGMALHFVFQWSGRNSMVGIVAPVNESAWEHLKMAFWPAALVTVVQLLVDDTAPGLGAARAIGFYVTAVLMVSMLVLSLVVLRAGMRGQLVADAVNFIVAVSLGQLVCYLLVRHGQAPTDPRLAIAMWVVPAAVFAVTTFVPPRWPLFRDLLTGDYGIPR
jgi:hypothetical protein